MTQCPDDNRSWRKGVFAFAERIAGFVTYSTFSCLSCKTFPSRCCRCQEKSSSKISVPVMLGRGRKSRRISPVKNDRQKNGYCRKRLPLFPKRLWETRQGFEMKNISNRGLEALRCSQNINITWKLHKSHFESFIWSTYCTTARYTPPTKLSDDLFITTTSFQRSEWQLSTETKF